MMVQAIALNFYSNPTFPDDCDVVSNRITNRNLFLLKKNEFYHFEMPSFENHSYSTICHHKEVMEAIEKSLDDDVYVLFFTHNGKPNSSYFIGYYKIGKLFYLETDYFDNDGYLVGFHSSETHLIEKEVVPYTQQLNDTCQRSSRCMRRTWSNGNDFNFLIGYIDQIKSYPNLESLYQKETREIITNLLDEDKTNKLREKCSKCSSNSQCRLWRRNKSINKKYNNQRDYFNVLNDVYNKLYGQKLIMEYKESIVELR